MINDILEIGFDDLTQKPILVVDRQQKEAIAKQSS
jgi:hypothetical protein